MMDQCGNLANTDGADRLFGSGDDVGVDLDRYVFVANEVFTEVEDTLNTLAFGSVKLKYR